MTPPARGGGDGDNAVDELGSADTLATPGSGATGGPTGAPSGPGGSSGAITGSAAAAARSAHETEPASAETVPASDVDGLEPRAPQRPSTGFRVVGPGTALGRYDVGDELGAGGMATVFRARDRELRRDVAIKVLFPHLARKDEVVRRFQREARAAAALEHDHILRVYDVGGGEVGADPPYIVMELVRGQSLRELSEGGVILAEVVACVGAILCDALAVAHAKGVIHRDVKPANVMIGPNGRLLLADFGVARIDDDDSLVTRTGALLGTPSFMAPEQAMGNPVDGRSDLYSVGASLYQLATASLPFTGPTARVVALITRGELVAPLRRAPAMGPDLARAIERLMALEPDRRPEDARAAAAMLREVAAAGGVDDADAELKAYFADPAAHVATRTRTVVARTVAAARTALAARALPRAMALADRAGALAPDDLAVRALGEEVAAGGRRRRGGVIAVALGGVGVAAVGGYALLAGGVRNSDSRDAAAVAMVVVDAPIDPAIDHAFDHALDHAVDPQARADATEATVVIDAAPPIDARDLDRLRVDARGRVDLRADARVEPGIDARGELPIVLDARPAEPAPSIDAAPALAHLTLAMDAWCNVTVDGADLGRADRKQPLALPPGRHELVCSQGPGLPSWHDTITLAPGADRTVTGSLLRSVAITVEVTGGDAVRVDGRLHARGSTFALPPGRYKVDLVDGTHVVGGAWVSVRRVDACTLRDQPELDCY